MGEVYRTRDARLGRDIALKVIAPGLAHETDLQQRLEREARAASALNRPAIVTVYQASGRTALALAAVASWWFLTSRPARTVDRLAVLPFECRGGSTWYFDVSKGGILIASRNGSPVRDASGRKRSPAS